MEKSEFDNDTENEEIEENTSVTEGPAKENDLNLYVEIDNIRYKLIISKDKKKNILFSVLPEEQFASKRYHARYSGTEIKKIGKSFMFCNKTEDFINEFKRIISYNEYDKKSNNITFTPLEKEKTMNLNIITKLNKEKISFALYQEDIPISERCKNILDYIKKYKMVTGIKSLSNNSYIQHNFDYSRIIKDENDIIFISNYILSIEKKNFSFNMIYQGSVDGDDANNFHQKCDNKSPILAIIKTKKDVIFGGYTSVEVNFKRKCYDDRAFCFNINNKKIYKNKNGEYAIWNRKETLLAFSSDYDTIYIGEGYFSKQFTTCPKDKANYEGMKKDFELNNGKESFEIKEFEVYQICFKKTFDL